MSRRREPWFVAERMRHPTGGPIPPDVIIATAMWYATKGYLYRITRYGEYEWAIRVRRGRIAPCPWWMYWIAQHVEAQPTMITESPDILPLRRGKGA